MNDKKEEKKKVPDKKEADPKMTIYIRGRKFKNWADVPDSLKPKGK
jgi:hypothetical protein